MQDLISNILSEDYVSAQEIFESRMQSIMERKLLEAKRDMQAEVFGGLSKQDIEDRRKAGYQKAADVLGDPYEARKRSLSPAKKKMMTTTKRKTKKKIDEDAMTRGLASAGKQAQSQRVSSGMSQSAKQEKIDKAKRHAGYKTAGIIQARLLGRGKLKPGQTDTSGLKRVAKLAARQAGSAAADYAKEKASQVATKAVDAVTHPIRTATSIVTHDRVKKAAKGFASGVLDAI